uniref:Uncharacterized protein n=1 Tax=Anguilla anguilla TaxID=7936 RepID=A0A0E9WX55_ANGAN
MSADCSASNTRAGTSITRQIRSVSQGDIQYPMYCRVYIISLSLVGHPNFTLMWTESSIYVINCSNLFH